MDKPQKKPLIPFTPVPLRTRRDGWTVEKQIAFIEALAENGIVEDACRRVGMSHTSANALRRRRDGIHFRRAWEIAVDYALYRIEEAAHYRSRHGVARPVFYKGEQVGEYRHFDERLTMFLLRSYRPERYGKALDVMIARGEEEGGHRPEDPGIALDGGLDSIEWGANDVTLGSDEDDEEPYAL